MKKTARAYTNIALIKYWGKQDAVWMIPDNSSVSITLDKFYTETTVMFDETLVQDQFILNGEIQSGKMLERVLSFLDIVRVQANSSLKAKVVSVNHVPTEAGLASSASAFAALAKAATAALGLSLENRDLSRLARRGSGSACRSVDGGFVVWHQGEDDFTSFAEPIDTEPWEAFRLIAFIASAEKKKVDSRQAMSQTKATSPYYQAWIKQANESITPMIDAIKHQNFHEVGRLAEASAMRMHASLLACDPPQWYFTPQSIELMNMVQAARVNGLSVYFTMDGGPNVKVLCLESEVSAFCDFAKAYGIRTETVVCCAGKGVTLHEQHLF